MDGAIAVFRQATKQRHVVSIFVSTLEISRKRMQRTDCRDSHAGTGEVMEAHAEGLEKRRHRTEVLTEAW